MSFDFWFRTSLSFSVPVRDGAQFIYLAIAARYYGVRVIALHAVGRHLIVTAKGHRADLAEFITVAMSDGDLRRWHSRAWATSCANVC